MRAFEIVPAAVAALALFCGAASAQVGSGGPACAESADLNAFTPRITDIGSGSAARLGCADALSLTPGARAEAGIGVTQWSALERRIDRLTLTPGDGDDGQPLVVVTGDSQSVILGARHSFGDFSIGGYLAYPQQAEAQAATSGGAGSYGLGAAYGGDDWWVGLAYRHVGQSRQSITQAPESAAALELTGRYEFGTGINLQGSLGWTERHPLRQSAEEADRNGGWYIVGTVKVPF